MNYDELLLQSAYERDETISDDDNEKLFAHYHDGVLVCCGNDESDVRFSYNHEDNLEYPGLHQFGTIEPTNDAAYDYRNMNVIDAKRI